MSTFTAACDLGITMHLVGVWTPGAFYIKTGEKYFNSAYGVACLGWDGTFHMILQGVRGLTTHTHTHTHTHTLACVPLSDALVDPD